MLRTYSGNAITAKARAIYGRRLTTANYKELLRLRSVSAVAAYLKETPAYRDDLSGVSELQIHRGQLENILNRAMLDRMLRMCHYDFSGKHSFFRCAVESVEIRMILRAIMMLNAGTQESLLFSLPAYMKPYTVFDFMALSKIRSFTELLHVLADTPYEKILRRHEAPNGEIDLSLCERDLKEAYYRDMLKIAQTDYKGRTRAQLCDLILTEAELLNISLIYRLKTFFNQSPEEIRRMLLPFHKKLTPARLTALLNAPGGAAFPTVLSKNGYPSADADHTYEYVEEYTKELRFTLSKRLMRSAAGAPVAFFALMTLLKIEVENVTTIIEGIRYQNNPDEIEKLLILE